MSNKVGDYFKFCSLFRMSELYNEFDFMDLKEFIFSKRFMRSSFLPKSQPKITEISALPSNKVPGQVEILGETMTS